MIKKIKIFLIIILLSQSILAQDSTKLSRQYFVAGSVSLVASALPYNVAYTTWVNNKNNEYSYLFVGVWFSFGVVLDINSVYCFRQSYKLRKKSLSL